MPQKNTGGYFSIFPHSHLIRRKVEKQAAKNFYQNFLFLSLHQIAHREQEHDD